MIQIRKAQDRGHADHGWLNAYHTFSFADYYDPQFMGYQTLRVINEDRVQPAKGFPPHSHRDMEIITYILEGMLEHKDSMGNGSMIRPDEVQYMSAGTGVTHSEFNASKEALVHLLQIWILPNQEGLNPGYAQKTFDRKQKEGKLCLVASEDGRNGSIRIYQDADIYASILGKGEKLNFNPKPGRRAWIQVARGGLTVNDAPLQTSDGAAIEGEKSLLFTSTAPLTEFLLFDLG